MPSDDDHAAPTGGDAPEATASPGPDARDAALRGCRRKRCWIGLALVGALVLAPIAGVFVWWPSPAGSEAAGSEASLRAGDAMSETMRAAAAAAANGRPAGPVRANGVVKPSRSVEVGTQQTGQLRKLHVGLGDRVTRGQLLAEIDPDLTYNEMESKSAGVARAKAQRQEAQAAFHLAELQQARARALMRADAMARRAFEQADAEYRLKKAGVDAAQAAVRVAQMELRIASKNLAQTRLLAPIDGVVVKVLIKEGQMVVGAQTAQVVLEVADLETMTVEAHVAEADVPYVHAGQRVSFSILANAQSRWHSTLRRIDPGSIQKADEAKAIYYRALFDVDNRDGMLRPMMTAEVSIETEDD